VHIEEHIEYYTEGKKEHLIKKIHFSLTFKMTIQCNVCKQLQSYGRTGNQTHIEKKNRSHHYLSNLKEIFTPKKKTISPFTHPHVIPNLPFFEEHRKSMLGSITEKENI